VRPLALILAAGLGLALWDRTGGRISAARLPWVLVVGLSAALWMSTCSSRNEIAASNAERDRARADETELRLAAADWSTAFAIEVEYGQSLEDVIAAQDQQLRVLGPATDSLIRQVELLEGQVRVLGELYIGAVGSIEAHDAVAHRTVSGDTTRYQVPDSITGDVSDGLLSAHVRATVEPPTVAIPSWSIDSLALVATVSELADGRALFAARAADPRVTIAMGDVYWQPPSPVAFCSLWTRTQDHGRGYAAGRLLELVLSQAFGG
jgi:hypothetical protein